MRRFIIEMGMGNSQYSRDYTKAAARAIEDAIRHSAIPMFGALDLEPSDMEVRVTIGVQAPSEVDTATLQKLLPRGKASVQAVFGGLDVVNPDSGATCVVATAAVEAFLPYQGDAFKS
jgi:uncharacterized protein (TIGR02058 family)